MEWLPREWGIRQVTPGAVLRPVARSDAMYALESQEITPPVLELKETPVKSTLEFTRARMAGPKFCETVPPRRNASELPSTRMAALRMSVELPLLCRLVAPKR